MARLDFRKLEQNLQKQDIKGELANRVDTAVKDSLSQGTYDKAVLFLGWVTVLLTVGTLALAYLDKAPEALWGALGAGIGGLAGIFTADA